MRINSAGITPGNGEIRIDGRPLGSGQFGGKLGFVSIRIDPAGNATLLEGI